MSYTAARWKKCLILPFSLGAVIGVHAEEGLGQITDHRDASVWPHLHPRRRAVCRLSSCSRRGSESRPCCSWRQQLAHQSFANEPGCAGNEESCCLHLFSCCSLRGRTLGRCGDEGRMTTLPLVARTQSCAIELPHSRRPSLQTFASWPPSSSFVHRPSRESANVQKPLEPSSSQIEGF